jgi:hypothetical protein
VTGFPKMEESIKSSEDVDVDELLMLFMSDLDSARTLLKISTLQQESQQQVSPASISVLYSLLVTKSRVVLKIPTNIYGTC